MVPTLRIYLAPFLFLVRTNVCWVKEGCSSLEPKVCSSLPLQVVDHVDKFDAKKWNLHFNKGCYTGAGKLQAQHRPPATRRVSASRSLGSTVTWAREITTSPTDVTDRSDKNWRPVFFSHFVKRKIRISLPIS